LHFNPYYLNIFFLKTKLELI